jgi:ferredoxin-nitrite reductase
VIRLWRDNGEREKRTKGRFRMYLDEIGHEEFRSQVEKLYGTLTPDPGSIFENSPRSHFGINQQKQDGLYYAGIHVPVGRLTAEDLQDIATASLKYGNGEIRLTEDQNIIITGLTSEKVEELKTDTLLQRFPLAPSNISAGTVSCTGNTYCSFALTNTKDQALKAAKELDEELNLPEEIKVHWTGCPNTCGQAYMGAIGLTGTKTKNAEGVMGEGYTMTIGGSQGRNPTIGQIYRKAIPAAEIKTALKEVLISKFGATEKK